MGHAPHAQIIWGVIVEPHDEDTGEPHPLYDEEGEMKEFPKESRLAWHYAGHEDEPFYILTYKGSYEGSAYGWDTEDIDASRIQSDVYEFNKAARKAEEERACDYPDLPSLHEAKWTLFATYG